MHNLLIPGTASGVRIFHPSKDVMRITSKGQVTIPQAIRERFGLHPHTAVHFREDNGKVILEAATDQPGRGQEGIQRLRKAQLRTRLSTEQLLALTRGEDP